MFDFQVQQKSLIAFQNADQDQLFKYYDNRNKTRLRKLRDKAKTTVSQTEELRILASRVLSILKKISDMGSLKGKHRINTQKVLVTADDIKESYTK